MPQSRFRKFNDNDEHFSYIKLAILTPETGIDNLITPCHEYKSLEIACKLEPRKLKIKFASEVIRFACACMNMRDSDARKCIKPPKFIPVIDKDSQAQNWIVEVDVVPIVNVVREKLYGARIPKFNEKANKVEYEQKAYYQRVGPNTPRVTEDELVSFIQALKDID